jgi:hypothetical protein
MKKGSCKSFETVSAAGVVAVVVIRCSHEVQIIVGMHNISAYLNYMRNAGKGQANYFLQKSQAISKPSQISDISALERGK